MSNKISIAYLIGRRNGRDNSPSKASNFLESDQREDYTRGYNVGKLERQSEDEDRDTLEKLTALRAEANIVSAYELGASDAAGGYNSRFSQLTNPDMRKAYAMGFDDKYRELEAGVKASTSSSVGNCNSIEADVRARLMEVLYAGIADGAANIPSSQSLRTMVKYETSVERTLYRAGVDAGRLVHWGANHKGSCMEVEILESGDAA